MATRMLNKACPTQAHTVQIDVYALAVNGQLKGHLLPKYTDLSIQTKDENWFLRMCHYVVIGINQMAEYENTVFCPQKCISVFRVILKINSKYCYKPPTHVIINMQISLFSSEAETE
jgi:hypothetical protein